MNKRKIFNDPVYGFISIPDELIFDIIEHPYFQRLRRIKQLGLTHLVYPGALHTRFHHALGAMHLMMQAIDILRAKGHDITDDESQAALIAILLHDIGHGPFSHGLENSIIFGISHEEISALYFQKFNEIFDSKLSTAISIFNNTYHKKFLHQLVSSQLDMDRLDYLKRDSFYTGVSEGVINSDRIINMLNIVDDNLVVESKGIYSVEKFIVARRLMYWQVYFHKTVLAAEYLLVKILQRARQLIEAGENIFITPALEIFLKNRITKENFLNNQLSNSPTLQLSNSPTLQLSNSPTNSKLRTPNSELQTPNSELRTPNSKLRTQNSELLHSYSLIDDYDIFACVKIWADADDKILSTLASNLVNRRLYKIELQNNPFSEDYIQNKKNNFIRNWNTNQQTPNPKPQTPNSELITHNSELRTPNSEPQTHNSELQTHNSKLQTQNSELITTNYELKTKSDLDYFVFTDSIKNNPYTPLKENICIYYKDGNLVDISQASDQLNVDVLSKTVTKYFLCYYK